MSITINDGNLSRFTNRLKKALHKKSIDLSLSEIETLTAQAFGKESYHELQKIILKSKQHKTESEKTVEKMKNIADITYTLSQNTSQMNIVQNVTQNIENPIDKANKMLSELILDNQESIIREAAIRVGFSMGRPGWVIGEEYIKIAIDKILLLPKKINI